MQILKRSAGITLIALIITIIILLILAGVSLRVVFNGGILDKAQSAVNEYESASKEEENLLEQIDKYIENELGEITNDEPVVPSVDGNGLAIEDTTIVAKDDPSIQIVIPQGFAPAILQTGTTQSLPGENGSVSSIMPAEEWNNIAKEDINSGIVVVDNAITYDGGQASGTVPDFNEYVWIPMPDISKFKRVAWNGPYWIGSWQNGEHPLADVSMSSKFWEETSSTEYKNMVDSIKSNKGFYISRYEASQKDSTTAQSKRGQSPWVNVTQTTATTGSINMKPDINSHLIYGIEWDSILQWFLDSQAKIGTNIVGGDLRTITIDDIQNDSESWGNYDNSVGDAADKSGSKQPSGTSEYWKVNNIYDIAGNVWEWTQENYSIDTSHSTRGGCYDNTNDNYPVVVRNNSMENYDFYDLRI